MTGIGTSFSIFTDETPGFDPAHQGLRFTLAVVLPAPRGAAERDITRILGPVVEPWGLPYHASAAEYSGALQSLRLRLAERIRNDQWANLLEALRRRSPSLKDCPEISLKRYLATPHGALVPDIDSALRSALAGVPCRAAAAARQLLGFGAYVLCGEHGSAAPREQWTRMMQSVIEHTLILLALEAPRDTTLTVDVVPAEAGGHATHFALAPFLEHVHASGLVATIAADPRPPVVKAGDSPGIQLADITLRELSRRQRRGPRLCRAEPVAQPESWTVPMLHERLPDELRPHAAETPVRPGEPAPSPSRPPWRVPAPLSGKEHEPLPVLDPCFNACGARETHSALRDALARLSALPGLQASLRNALDRRWRTRTANGSTTPGFPFERSLPFAYQMTLPILEELARRAAVAAGAGGATGSIPEGSAGPTAAGDPAGSAPMGAADSHDRLAWKDLETMGAPTFEVSLPRVSVLPAATSHPALLLAGERIALEVGRDPYLWAVGIGRLLRWREHAQVDRELGKACRGVQAAEVARIAGDGCALLVQDIRDLAAVLRGAEGPPNVAWALLSARDDLESARLALRRIEREVRRDETPDLAEELEFQLAEIKAALPAVDAEMAHLEAEILYGLVRWPEDPHRLRLDALDISSANAAPSEAFRAVLDRLVVLRYQLVSGELVEDAPFVTDDLAAAYRAPESWFVATDVAAAVPPSQYQPADVAHAWLTDCGRQMELLVRARPEKPRALLGIPPPTAPETPPAAPPGTELPAETRAWLRARRATRR